VTDPTLTQAAQQKERDEKLWQAYLLVLLGRFLVADKVNDFGGPAINDAEAAVQSWERATGRRQ
jgi:hypothetical protein